ncbi:MAG: hypothetical protein AAFQ82_00795 [Myxococcota bacterium]
MIVFAIVLLLCAAVLELTLGARLLWLARVTRGAPEISMGLAFLLDAIAQVSGTVAQRLEGGAQTWAFGVTTWLTVLATSALLWGVVAIFEQHRPWVSKAVWIVIAGVAGALLAILLGVRDTPFITARWVNRGFTAFTFVWAVLGSLSARQACLRQIPLGLSTRLEAARFGLWAFAAGAYLCVLVLVFARDVLGMPSAVTLAARPLLAFACVLAVWCTFFPPRWLEQRLDG